MPTGTGMSKLQAAFPDRFIDVGIAEQHAVTLATGLALGGMRPVVALYSTFLQRAFDQTVHDVCQNDAPVLLAVDRAGLVGEDGTSHQGMFTLPAQRMLPNLVIASPRDEQELRSLVRTALAQDHPFALHYPRDAGFGVPEREPEVLPVGRGEVLREGRDLLFVTFGPITGRALEVADALEARGWSVGVVNARFAKPLDTQLILDRARGKRLVVTFEESVVTGGFGSGVLEAFEEARLADAALREVPVRILGHPGRPVRGPRVGHGPPAPHPPRRPRAHRPGRPRRSRSSGSRPRPPPADQRARGRRADPAARGVARSRAMSGTVHRPRARGRPARRPRPARRWVVIVWNDPVNLMTYVTYVFRKLFGYSHARAHALMLQVHLEGRAVVSGGTLERCEHDASRLHAHGLWATISQD